MWYSVDGSGFTLLPLMASTDAFLSGPVLTRRPAEWDGNAALVAVVEEYGLYMRHYDADQGVNCYATRDGVNWLNRHNPVLRPAIPAWPVQLFCRL
jgi:hypothetical protein